MHKTKPTILWQLHEGSWKHLIPSKFFPLSHTQLLAESAQKTENSQKCKRWLTILWQSQDQPNEYQFLRALNRNVHEQKLITVRDTLNLHGRLKQNPIASRDGPNEYYANPSNRFKITPDGFSFMGYNCGLVFKSGFLFVSSSCSLAPLLDCSLENVPLRNNKLVHYCVIT
jgi:hypothetical protein